MRVIGHRGCADLAPENTVRAVRGAAPNVDMVEVDVRRCASGELVVFHDETLDRLTEATGRVDETPWTTLRSLTVAGTGAHVPLLSTLLGAVPPAVGVNVELKHAGMAEEVVSLCERVPNEVVVSSFDPAALEGVAARSDLPLALLFDDDWDANLDRAQSLGCAYVHPEYHLLLEEAGRVADAHAVGLGVNAWTVPTAEAVDRLRAAGVDGVVVDRPDVV